MGRSEKGLLTCEECVTCVTLTLCLSLSLSSTALSLLPGDAAVVHWLSPVLVLPVMQLLHCCDISEPLVDQKTYRQNVDLAHSLLRHVTEKTCEPEQVSAVHGC